MILTPYNKIVTPNHELFIYKIKETIMTTITEHISYSHKKNCTCYMYTINEAYIGIQRKNR